MKNSKTIRFKAALLVLVFSLNTLIGFACSLGLNLGYNQHHHEAEVAAPGSNTDHHGHGSEKKHHEKQTQHYPVNESSNDDCCGNGVTSFNLINKTVPQQVELVNPVFFTAFTATWFSSGILPYINVEKDIKPFVRSHHPPIPDIRIAIQSFQI
ncbi:MAG: hypothetical protein ABIT96_03190 [Ferruginibacter sp.]